MCYVKAKGSTSDPDSNIVYVSNSQVTITEFNKTKLAPKYIHTYIHTYTQLQKSVILGTCSIVRNFSNHK